MERIQLYSRFERFWHWSQALLILTLMVTGFGIHGSHDLLTYSQAGAIHVTAAWALIVLWVFALFWDAITGEWRQFIPTTRQFREVALYYTKGVFDPKIAHPYKKTPAAKHNPLQRLAYLLFLAVISPVIWVSGLLYLYYNEIAGLPLGLVAFVHTAAAFALLVFFIGHVYMAFTAKPVFAYVKAMITGYEDAHP